MTPEKKIFPCGAFLGGLGAAQKGPAGLAIGKTRKKQRKKQRKKTKEHTKENTKEKTNLSETLKFSDTELLPGLKANRARTPGKGNRNTFFQNFAKKEIAKC